MVTRLQSLAGSCLARGWTPSSVRRQVHFTGRLDYSRATSSSFLPFYSSYCPSLVSALSDTCNKTLHSSSERLLQLLLSPGHITGLACVWACLLLVILPSVLARMGSHTPRQAPHPLPSNGGSFSSPPLRNPLFHLDSQSNPLLPSCQEGTESCPKPASP